VNRITDWVKWEFGRRIEVTTAIRLITIERFLKATVLIVGGLLLIVVGAKTDVHKLVEEIQDQLNLTQGRGFWRGLAQRALERFGTLSRDKQDLIAIGAILYGALEGFEGVGLLLRRRWAEYLVLVATAAFLPLEIDELVRKPTALKALALLVNLLIIGYLIWRKRLFLERPGHMTADATEQVPADLRERSGQSLR
jgi:uncharacterized membrane protein (DUF2068 family)